MKFFATRVSMRPPHPWLQSFEFDEGLLQEFSIILVSAPELCRVFRLERETKGTPPILRVPFLRQPKHFPKTSP